MRFSISEWLALTSLMTLCAVTSSQNATCTWQNAAVPVPSVNCQGSVLTVRYNDISVTCDDAFTDINVLEVVPHLQWSGAVAGQRYLMVMVDPDASYPCEPELRYILHWVAYLDGPGLQMNHEFVEYRGPHPPVGSVAHRYQFLLFAWNPPPGLNNPDLLGHFSGQRFRFDLDHFKVVNHLGDPVASFQFMGSRN